MHEFNEERSICIFIGLLDFFLFGFFDVVLFCKLKSPLHLDNFPLVLTLFKPECHLCEIMKQLRTLTVKLNIWIMLKVCMLVQCEMCFKQPPHWSRFIIKRKSLSQEDKCQFLTYPEQKRGFEHTWSNKPFKSYFTNYFWRLRCRSLSATVQGVWCPKFHHQPHEQICFACLLWHCKIQQI